MRNKHLHEGDGVDIWMYDEAEERDVLLKYAPTVQRRDKRKRWVMEDSEDAEDEVERKEGEDEGDGKGWLGADLGVKQQKEKCDGAPMFRKEVDELEGRVEDGRRRQKSQRGSDNTSRSGTEASSIFYSGALGIHSELSAKDGQYYSLP